MVIYPVFLIRFEMKEDENFDEMERAVDQYVVYVIIVWYLKGDERGNPYFLS